MLKQRRIEIAFEIARVFVFGSNWRDCAAWCSGCESYVPLVTIFIAATLNKTTCAEIFQRVEIGGLHHQSSDEGALLVCLSSLLDTVEETGKGNPVSDFSETQPEQIHYLARRI